MIQLVWSSSSVLPLRPVSCLWLCWSPCPVQTPAVSSSLPVFSDCWSVSDSTVQCWSRSWLISRVWSVHDQSHRLSHCSISVLHRQRLSHQLPCLVVSCLLWISLSNQLRLRRPRLWLCIRGVFHSTALHLLGSWLMFLLKVLQLVVFGISSSVPCPSQNTSCILPRWLKQRLWSFLSTVRVWACSPCPCCCHFLLHQHQRSCVLHL